MNEKHPIDNSPIQAIILAAGKGTRMNVDYPKCGYPIFGKPMIEHITTELDKNVFSKIIVVVGYKKETILDILKDNYVIAEQKEQLGTGDAVKCALSKSYTKGISVIIPGDMPFVTMKIINNLLNVHQEKNNDLTIVTMIVNDPSRYGRIKRENGKFTKIIEYLDLDENEKTINEVNSGLIAVNTSLLFTLLDKLEKHTNKNEYYLTDLVALMADKYKVDAYLENDSSKLVGINDLETLQEIEKKYK